MDINAPMQFPDRYYSIHDMIEELSHNVEAFKITAQAIKLATNFDLKVGVGMYDMMKM